LVAQPFFKNHLFLYLCENLWNESFFEHINLFI
jgi:hypothetical protein